MEEQQNSLTLLCDKVADMIVWRAGQYNSYFTPLPLGGTAMIQWVSHGSHGYELVIGSKHMVYLGQEPGKAKRRASRFIAHSIKGFLLEAWAETFQA